MTPHPITLAKAKVAALLAPITALPFGPEKAIITLVLLQFLDWLTGVWAAKKEGSAISSERARAGAFKKGMMWVYVCIAAIAVWLAPVSSPVAELGFTGVVCFFAWVEVISIAENGRRIGFPMPKVLLRLLDGMRPSDGEPIPTGDQERK
jgi:toxin secretion/phage lysis holin